MNRSVFIFLFLDKNFTYLFIHTFEPTQQGYAFLEISVPELPESDSESDVGSKVDDEDIESWSVSLNSLTNISIWPDLTNQSIRHHRPKVPYPWITFLRLWARKSNSPRHIHIQQQKSTPFLNPRHRHYTNNTGTPRSKATYNQTSTQTNWSFRPWSLPHTPTLRRPRRSSRRLPLHLTRNLLCKARRTKNIWPPQRTLPWKIWHNGLADHRSRRRSFRTR